MSAPPAVRGVTYGEGDSEATGGGGGGDNITINASAVSDADFNDTVPAAPPQGPNILWQQSGSGPTSVSAYVQQSSLSLTNIGGTLTISKGGTSNTTALSAFNALSPLTTRGDLITHNGTNNIRRAAGAVGQVLMANASGDSVWNDPAFNAALFEIFNGVDPTRIGRFDAAGISTLTTRTFTFPDSDGTLALTGSSIALLLSTATAAGSSLACLRSDDTIKAFDSTAITSAVLSATAAGISSFAARADHTHKLGMATTAGDVLGFDGSTFARHAIGTHGQVLTVATGNADKLDWTTITGGASGGSPSVLLASATAAGAATTFVRTDDTIKAFDRNTPPAISESAGAAGTATFAAASDHTHLLNTVSIAKGGTGQTAKTAAFDALSPLTTLGDFLTFDGTDNIRVAVGANYTSPMADTAVANSWSWQPAMRTARKTALENFTTTALASITNLLFTAAANTTYNFDFQLPFVTTGTTTGLKLGITFPSSPTYVDYEFVIPTATTTLIQTAFSATGQSLVAATSPGTVQTFAQIHGTLVNGASTGVIQAQAASETNTATVTINRGAWGWCI